MLSMGSQMQQISLKDRRIFFRYGMALLLVFLAFGARLFCDFRLGIPLSPFILFYPTVIVAAWYGGLGPALLSLGLSLLLGRFFFVEPRYGFLDINVPDFFHMMLFLFVSLTISFLIENLHRTVIKQSQASIELLGSQKKISSILESVRGCFFSLDEKRRFIHLNEDCKDYINLPREHYIGKSVWEAFGGWRGTDFEAQLALAQEKKERREFEFFDERKSKWYDVHLAATMEGISVHIHDITDRKEAENALMESEERFRLVADRAPVMVWMAGEDALFHYFNEPWLKFRGRSLDQEKGNAWTEGIHPEDLQNYMDAYMKALHARESFRIEYRLQRFDGQYRWVLDTGVPRFGPRKKFMGYIGSAIDITGRKEVEERQNLEYRITQFLAEEENFKKSVEKILVIICEGLNWQVGAYWQVDPLTNVLRCSNIISIGGLTSSRFLEDCPKFTFIPGEDLPGRVWSLGKAFWIQDVVHDSNFPRAAIAEAAGLKSGVCFPIRLGPEILGVMEFFHSKMQEPDSSLIQMLESIGIEISQAIERGHTKEALKMAYEEMEKRVQERTVELERTNEVLKKEIQERLKVEREVLEISLKEQRRLGAFIHDDLCQNLAGITMMAKVLKQKMERKEFSDNAGIQQITDLLDQATLQAREIARGFYPVELQGDSLMIALKDLAQRMEKLYQISCIFDCPEPVFIEDNNIATHLFRITQEATLNAVKHGKAGKVIMRLLQQGGRMQLTIEDNGIGLSVDTQSGKGIGMNIMKYRARMIDANLDICNINPNGTKLSCSFSLQRSGNRSDSGSLKEVERKEGQRA
jgi:PAS domain S-box-containing protein